MRIRIGIVAALLMVPTTARAQLIGQPQTITVVDSGTACVTAPTACASFAIRNAESVTIDVSGTWTGTLTFEATANGSIWRSVLVTDASSGTASTTATSNGTYVIPNVGYLGIRARATAAVTGSAYITATQGYSGVGGGSTCTVSAASLTAVASAVWNATRASYVTAGSFGQYTNANLTNIDSNATSGNNATLYLKQLNITNSGGIALIAESTGSNGSGVYFKGNGSGPGVQSTAGSTSGAHGWVMQGSGSGSGTAMFGGATGNGFLAYGGATSGHGAYFRNQAGAGDGIHTEALGSDGDGINASGVNGSGLYAQGGGADAPGIAAISTSTSAPGLYALGNGNNSGIGAFGQGSGAGIQGFGGATGNGLWAQAGATGGSGGFFRSQASGQEGVVFTSTTAAPGFGVYGSSGDSDPAYGAGIYASGATGSPDIAATLGQSWSRANITTNTTTTVKSGAGFVHAININKGAVTSTITVYDNTAGSGTAIGGVVVDTLAGGTAVIYDVNFSTGLTIVTAGGAAADLTVTYK